MDEVNISAKFYIPIGTISELLVQFLNKITNEKYTVKIMHSIEYDNDFNASHVKTVVITNEEVLLDRSVKEQTMLENSGEIIVLQRTKQDVKPNVNLLPEFENDNNLERKSLQINPSFEHCQSIIEFTKEIMSYEVFDSFEEINIEEFVEDYIKLISYVNERKA